MFSVNFAPLILSSSGLYLERYLQEYLYKVFGRGIIGNAIWIVVKCTDDQRRKMMSGQLTLSRKM